jgi:hypothetical protein
MSIKTKPNPVIAAIFVSCFAVSSAFGKTAQETDKHVKPKHAVTEKATAEAKPGPSGNWHDREGVYFQRNWGVDIVGVRPVSSGYMLEFRYRVLDPKKAQSLNNKKARPYVIDEATGIRLAVPSMENIGELRQVATPEANRTYFMIFGNPGKLVKSGSPVSVVIGDFRVNGLIVN